VAEGALSKNLNVSSRLCAGVACLKFKAAELFKLR
jgi:hypothetical protein